MHNSLPHLDALRRQILTSALDRAAFDGWNAATLLAAQRDAELPDGTVELVCPAGVVDLLDFWGLECDRATETTLAGTDLAALRIRERVRAGVLARIDAIGDANREAARRAVARLAAPDAVSRGARITWRAADTIWRALGDPSTDFNFYSKRAILSGVIASTMGVWLEGEEPEKTESFLDRRIDNIMQFEKVKARVRGLSEKLPDPIGLLARLRYGR